MGPLGVRLGERFYSAAAQAAGVSWKAWFFGSSDAANWITVDKTPAALWVDGLAVRIFGLSSWSVLAPQALMGVATVALLYATVRRTALAADLRAPSPRVRRCSRGRRSRSRRWRC